MPTDRFFDRTVGVLTKVLICVTAASRLYPPTLPTSTLPGYTPARLRFEKDLQQALASNERPATPTHAKHFALGGGNVEQITGRIDRLANNNGIGDQNGVDLDQEMVAQAENQIYYEAATQMLNKKLGLLKYVVQSDR
ncbi:MAG: hypothetical protein R2864_03465 [Syntrophotaleaceae bacterium]